VTDGIESALRQATTAARGKDVRISGGAATVAQYLNAGLVDDLTLHVAPVLLGDGVRLFEQARPDAIALAQAQASGSPLVTHIRYTITRR
jgi:dihydrofolate reductase